MFTRDESKQPRLRDTDTRPMVGKKTLLLFRRIYPYTYIYISIPRLLSLVARTERRRNAREEGPATVRRRRTIHTGRGRGQFGPFVVFDPRAKRERREGPKKRERGGALWTTLCVLWAVRASRLGRGWRADERCYLGGAAMVTEQR